MLKSYEAIYDHGHLKWIGEAPQVGSAKVILTILEEAPHAPMRRQPPPSLKGSVTYLVDDPFTPVMTEEESKAE